MITRQRSAIVFGATGLVGGYLLNTLLADPLYANVTAVVRRDIGQRHDKLKLLIADLQTINKVKHALTGDDVFCCLGTTRKKTPDLDAYYRIDHDYPVRAAELTKAMGASAFVLVSALGANVASRNFYLRMKGETECDVLAVGFERTHLFRPSLLMGSRNEKRWAEELGQGISMFINPLLINGLSKFRSIHIEPLARAMVRAAADDRAGVRIYYWKDIKRLG